MRRSKQEIIELFQACQTKLGKTPGWDVLCAETGLTEPELSYYWAKPRDLATEAGAPPNTLMVRLDDADVFRDYAKICLDLECVPTLRQLRIKQRELKTRTHTVYTRDGSIHAFQGKFRKWLSSADDNLKQILDFKGWATVRAVNVRENELAKVGADPALHPFLPGCLQYLDALARGEMPPFEPPGTAANILFERRTADAFRCLGFEMEPLGQGTGRNADCIAQARRERTALIIDAKVRTNGYVLGTEDRKFLEYAEKHCKQLQREGFESIYFVVVGPSFRDFDLKKLGDYLSTTPIRSVDMITARALMNMVEESIRGRSTFSLSDVTKKLFGNKIIA